MGIFDTKRFPMGTLEGISPSQQTLNEPVHVVIDSKIKLNYIPDEVYRVYISGYVENTYNTPITTSTQFIVDYNNGMIYFDSSQEGVSITVTEYWKQGMITVSGSNVVLLDGETLEEMQSRVDEKATKVQESFISPTLLNSFVNFGGTDSIAGYYKNDFEVVNIRGKLKTGASGTVAFILPLGYRPSYDMTFVINSNNAFGKVDISTTGNVTLTGNATFYSLDGISFRVGE